MFLILASSIIFNDGTNCNQFVRWKGVELEIFGGDHDQTHTPGTGMDLNTGLESYMYFLDGSTISERVSVKGVYLEGITASGGNGMIHAINCDNPDISFNRFTNLRGVSNVASIFIKFGAGVHGQNAGGNKFKGSPGTAYVDNNAAGGICTTFPENIFRDASDVKFLTWASLQTRMSEAVTDILAADGMHWARPVFMRSITTTAGIRYPHVIGRGLNGSTVAANDGVGVEVQIENDAAHSPNPTYTVAAREHWLWVSAASGAETAKKVMQMIVSGALTEIFAYISTGIKLMGGPSITVGTGVPATSEPNGSLFLRTDGTGPNLYVRENGAWVAK